MTLLDELTELENGFWHATTDAGYYGRHMREDGLAVFAGAVMTKGQAIASTEGDAASGWEDVAVTDARLLEISPEVAALVYEGSASRRGTPYRATCASVYARQDGAWRMVLHQQSEVRDQA